MKYAFIFFLLFSSFIGYSQNKYSCEVYFDSGKDALSLASTKTLDSLVNKIPPKNKFTISISGYCDSIGNGKFNYDLSLRRANSVKTYFINKNIKYDSIIVSGYSNNKPKYLKNNWNKNRRVNVVITIIPQTKKNDIKKFDTTKSVIGKFIETAKVGDKIALKNITFRAGLAIPLPESYETLDELFKTLKSNPTLEIRIEGHVCCTKNDDGDLSGERAKAVYKYLVDKGINKDRLSYKGFGHTKPITSERNELEQQMNRRVEIRIVKK